MWGGENLMFIEQQLREVTWGLEKHKGNGSADVT